MIKPNKLQKNDKVALVSLSSGIFGDENCKERLDRTINNLKTIFDIELVIMPNALKGSKYLYEHPEVRAKDLMDAFLDKDIKAIFTFTGGDDTIRLLPYIDFDIIKNNPKIFMGFSDTTINHFMMYKAGLISYYGPAAGVEFSLPNVEQENIDTVLNTLFKVNNNLELNHYLKYANDPLDWSTSILDIEKDEKGYELIQGSGIVTGKLLGGCIDTFNMMMGTNIWPEINEWKDKILFIETSDEQPDPSGIKRILYNMGVQGIFNNIKGILVGRPKNGKYYEEYNELLKEITRIFNAKDLPILSNCHFGHAWLWNIMPLGLEIKVDYDNKKICLNESSVK